MKNLLFIVAIFVAFVLETNCQVYYKSNSKINEVITKSQKTRTAFIFANIGLVDPLSLGAGVQSNRYAFSIVFKMAWVGSGYYTPNSAKGVGVRISYSKQFLFLNMISLEYVPFYELQYYRPNKPIKTFSKGYYFDVSVGKEEISISGCNFYWSVGFAISAAKHEALWYGPSIKIGYNYNLIN